MQRLRWHGCLPGPVRSVLLLCWRDTGHPQGGGSEAYLQRIGAQLAASGVDVTLRTARYPGSARREVVDGVQINRAGGAYSIYIWAGLAMVLARFGLGPLRKVRPGRGDRHPERAAVPGPPRLRSPRRRSGAPLPPRTVARRRPLEGALRLVRRVTVVAMAAPAQPVRHGVAAVGAGSDRPRCRRRAHRGGTQRARRGSAADARAAARGASAHRRAQQAGAAQADRGRARRRRRAAATDARPAPRHRRWRLVARPPRRPRAAARGFRRGDVPRPRR